SKRVEMVAHCLNEAGAVGIGQSSWGPTGFAFAPSQDAALKFVDAVRKTTVEGGLEVKIVKGRNSGAKISSTRLDLVGS
ncbi:GHMP kinase, partial [Mesorhizobium sp. M7A.F.Ca.US.003.02.2.1]